MSLGFVKKRKEKPYVREALEANWIWHQNRLQVVRFPCGFAQVDIVLFTVTEWIVFQKKKGFGWMCLWMWTRKILGFNLFCGTDKDYSILSDPGLENPVVHSQQGLPAINGRVSLLQLCHFIDFYCSKEHNLALQIMTGTSIQCIIMESELERYTYKYLFQEHICSWTQPDLRVI